MQRMAKKPGVMLYFDSLRFVPDLTLEDCGRLFRAILAYSEFGEVPEFTGELRIAWVTVKPKIDHDAEQYERKSRNNAYSTYCRETKKQGKEPVDKETFISHYEFESNDIERYRTTSNDTNRYRTISNVVQELDFFEDSGQILDDSGQLCSKQHRTTSNDTERLPTTTTTATTTTTPTATATTTPTARTAAEPATSQQFLREEYKRLHGHYPTW